MSSSVCRILPAAAAISSTISRVRSRVDAAPSADAPTVRSNALRTASRTSARRPCRPSCPSSSCPSSPWLGHFSSMTHSVSPETIHLRPHADVAERVSAPRRSRARAAPGAAVGRRDTEDAQPQPRPLGVQRDRPRRRAADGAGHRHGRPQRGDRGRGARPARRPPLRARRHLRRAAGELALGELLAAEAALPEDGASRALGATGPLAADPVLQRGLQARRRARRLLRPLLRPGPGAGGALARGRRARGRDGGGDAVRGRRASRPAGRVPARRVRHRRHA